MKDYRQEYEKKKRTIPQVLGEIQSGMNIYVGVDMAEPVAILKELHTIEDRVRDVTVCSVLGPEDYPHLQDPRGKYPNGAFLLRTVHQKSSWQRQRIGGAAQYQHSLPGPVRLAQSGYLHRSGVSMDRHGF